MDICQIKQFITSGERKKIDRGNCNYQNFCSQQKALKQSGIRSVSLGKFCKDIAQSRRLNMLLGTLENVKLEFIYKSYMYGIRHNIRVALYAFYISEKLGLSDEDLKIILFGALYHDIARKNDLLDSSHGALGAQIIEQLHLDLTAEQLGMLKCIIACHSVSDNEFEKIAEHFGVKDTIKCKTLMNVLKDSDALDLTRFAEIKIVVDYFRTEVAPKLILAAYELNYNLNLDNLKL